MQPRRHVVARQLMSAARAELVCCPHGSIAVSATGRELIVALRAKMEVALHLRSARRAARDFRLAEQKIQHGADAGRHYKANQHPEPYAHRAAWRILAYVPDHQEVESRQKSPGEIEINPEPDRRNVVLLFRQDEPEVVLNRQEGGDGNDDGPHRDEARVFVDGNRLWIGHGDSNLTNEYRLLKANLASSLVDGPAKSEVAT